MEWIFKAKSEDNGKWYEFSFSDINSTNERVVIVKVDHSSGYAFLLVNTISQYTGISDSEGNRIFEGDEFKGGGIVSYSDDRFYVRFVGDTFRESLSIYSSKDSLTGRNIHDQETKL